MSVTRSPIEFPQPFEHPHAFALVFDFGIELGHPALAHGGQQIIHRQQMFLPGVVDDFQQHQPLHPAHFWMVAIFDDRLESCR